MITRFTSIFLAILLLSGCASYNKSKDERSGSKENINKKYTTKYSKTLEEKEISSFAIDISKIVNKRDALNILGDPLNKITFFLQWKTLSNSPIRYEYIELWKWENPMKVNILFNEKGNVFDKFQLTTLDFNNKK